MGEGREPIRRGGVRDGGWGMGLADKKGGGGWEGWSSPLRGRDNETPDGVWGKG